MSPARLIPFLAAFALVACGSDDDVASDALATVEVPRQNPALVSPGTPGAALRRLWTMIEKGAVPPAVDGYLPRVRRRTGLSTLAGGIADAQFRLRTLRTPVVIERLSTSRGALLTVLAAGKEKGSDGFRGIFLMQRVGGRWLVAYDSLMATAVSGYVTNRIQASVKPGAKPGAKAATAGLRAADNFRTALFGQGELAPAGR